MFLISKQEMQNTLVYAQSSNPELAAAAINKLGRLKAKEAAPILIARITDTEPLIRQACTQYSFKIVGDAAVVLLEGRLSDSAMDIGLLAASCLAYIGTASAAETLVRARNSQNPIVARHARFGLETWDGNGGQSVFINAILREKCIASGEFAFVLARMGDTRVLPVLDLAFEKETDASNKLCIAAAQTMLGYDKRKFIRAALHSTDVSVKMTALFCIVVMEDTGAISDVVALLGDADMSVALEAVDTLAALGLTHSA